MSKAAPPSFSWMKWFPRDFTSSTRTWPLIAKAIYRELLDAQWDIGGLQPATLPEDPEQLRELVRASPAEWRIGWPLVEPKFPLVPGGGRRNARLEGHRLDAVAEYEKRKRGALTTNRKLGRGNGLAHDYQQPTGES